LDARDPNFKSFIKKIGGFFKKIIARELDDTEDFMSRDYASEGDLD
jgi:carbamate kinase